MRQSPRFSHKKGKKGLCENRKVLFLFFFRLKTRKKLTQFHFEESSHEYKIKFEVNHSVGNKKLWARDECTLHVEYKKLAKTQCKLTRVENHAVTEETSVGFNRVRWKFPQRDTEEKLLMWLCDLVVSKHKSKLFVNCWEV